MKIYLLVAYVMSTFFACELGRAVSLPSDGVSQLIVITPDSPRLRKITELAYHVPADWLWVGIATDQLLNLAEVGDDRVVYAHGVSRDSTGYPSSQLALLNLKTGEQQEVVTGAQTYFGIGGSYPVAYAKNKIAHLLDYGDGKGEDVTTRILWSYDLQTKRLSELRRWTKDLPQQRIVAIDNGKILHTYTKGKKSYGIFDPESLTEVALSEDGNEQSLPSKLRRFGTPWQLSTGQLYVSNDESVRPGLAKVLPAPLNTPFNVKLDHQTMSPEIENGTPARLISAPIHQDFTESFDFAAVKTFRGKILAVRNYLGLDRSSRSLSELWSVPIENTKETPKMVARFENFPNYDAVIHIRPVILSNDAVVVAVYRSTSLVFYEVNLKP